MNVDIRSVYKSYFLHDVEVPVLHNMNLSVKHGELISLTGPSGVGKSTFLHLIGTLDSPSRGAIFYNSSNLQYWNDTKIAEFRNKNIGYVFQFHHLLSEFNALENVAMPLMMRRMDRYNAYNKAKSVLEFVGLSKRLVHKPGELSGGEQQRVALARALAQDPSLLLADEPTGNLDEKTGQDIVDLILQYNHEHHASVILVSHNKHITMQFSRKLVLDHNGLSES